MVATLLGIACTGAPEPTADAPHDHPAAYELAKPERRWMGKEVEMPGRVDVPPSGWVSLNLPFGGRVVAIDVIPGDQVHKGQVIGSIDDPRFLELQRDYVTALQEQEQAERDYRRREPLVKDSVVSDKQWQATKSAWVAAKARAGALAGQLVMLGIDPARLADGQLQLQVPLLAPVNGYVAEVNAHVGKQFQPGEAAVKVVDLSHLHLELQAFASDLPLLQEGQRLSYQLAGSKQVGQATIYRLTAQVSPGSNSSQVHAHLEGSEKGLRPGQFLRATVLTQTDSVYTLPAEAVVTEGEHYLIFKMENGQPTKQQVQLGRKTKDFVEVMGLDPNAQYVVKGAYGLSIEREEEGGHSH